MFNLIRMNLYRIFHTRSTYIMLAVIMVFAGFSAYMMREDIKMLEEEITAEGGQLNEAQTDEIVPESDDASTPLTIMVETPYHEDGTKPAFTEYLCADLRSGLILIILAIFPVLFVNSEEKSGFVKNIAGQTKRREWIYLSKQQESCFLILWQWRHIRLSISRHFLFCIRENRLGYPCSGRQHVIWEYYGF